MAFSFSRDHSFVLELLFWEGGGLVQQTKLCAGWFELPARLVLGFGGSRHRFVQ